MGENTFRYSPGPPGVQIAGDGPGDRKKRAAVGPASQGPSASDIVALAAATFRAEPSATYWRRRLISLAIGLAILGAVSWGLSQALQAHLAGRSSDGTLRTAGSDSAPRAGNSAAGGGQPGGTTGSQGGQSSGGAPGKSGTGAAAGPSPAPKPSVTASGFGGVKPAFCSRHSIVLSLSAARVHFGSGQQPAFSLSVVSTQPTNCSFNVGPGHLAVVIKEGRARIWSSADCVNGTGSLLTALRRGVPTVVTIGWNRRTSSPGCGGSARSVPAGSYTAYAVEGAIVSSPVTLRLS
jgi:hypothetical protein